MNESFIADAKKLDIELQTLRLSGGHKFPVVEKALPAALDFLEISLGNPKNSPK
jgi:hypothetical protein